MGSTFFAETQTGLRQSFPHHKKSKITPSSINNLFPQLCCQHPQDPGDTSVHWNHRQAPGMSLICSHIFLFLLRSVRVSQPLSGFPPVAPELTLPPAAGRDYPSRDLHRGRSRREQQGGEASSVSSVSSRCDLFRHVCLFTAV